MQWRVVSAGDLKLITAVIVAAALFLPTLKKKRSATAGGEVR